MQLLSKLMNCFPWRRRPSLSGRESAAEASGPGLGGPPSAISDRNWVRLGYVVLAAVFLGRLAFLASGRIELSKDEAYQWLWSKHLALSYYSKPPMIAYTQWLGTMIFGDTAFGVRFFSPVIGTALALMLLRWIARLAGGRTAFWLVVLLQATPLMAVGMTLLTIDPLVVFCWTVAMMAGWRALQPDATVWHWLGVGLAMGLGFLSKYNALYQVVCWAIFFALWPPARRQLRRPGPWLALLLLSLCTLPVLVWNAQHHWITLQHVSVNAELNQKWQPTMRFFWEFIGAEIGLLNPVFLVAAFWAIAKYRTWRPQREESPSRAPRQPRAVLMLYLLCMSAPVFFGHWLYTFHSRVQPNWIAPAVVPMFCLMVLYWDHRWREGARAVRTWLMGGLILGFVAAAVLHGPELVGAVVGKPLPPDKDPLRRVRAWKETAAVVSAARDTLLAEGKPVFVVAHHYGVTGLLSFYMPEARINLSTRPLVYSVLGSLPENQLYFWPEYRYKDFRTGQNALFVVEVDVPQYSMKAWFDSLFTGAPEPPPADPQPEPVAWMVQKDFDSVTDLGVRPVLYHGRIYRWVQLLECRNLH
jgi:4-amino-4-deoxy-L-arabinose transferase-like glycosyltransferase